MSTFSRTRILIGTTVLGFMFSPACTQMLKNNRIFLGKGPLVATAPGSDLFPQPSRCCPWNLWIITAFINIRRAPARLVSLTLLFSHLLRSSMFNLTDFD